MIIKKQQLIKSCHRAVLVFCVMPFVFGCDGDPELLEMYLGINPDKGIVEKVTFTVAGETTGIKDLAKVNELSAINPKRSKIDILAIREFNEILNKAITLYSKGASSEDLEQFNGQLPKVLMFKLMLGTGEKELWSVNLEVGGKKYSFMGTPENGVFKLDLVPVLKKLAQSNEAKDFKPPRIYLNVNYYKPTQRVYVWSF